MTALTSSPSSPGPAADHAYGDLVNDVPGIGERIFVIVAFYFLVYGLPDTMFLSEEARRARELTADANLTNTLVSTGIYLGALAILALRSWWLREAIRRDGLVVLLVGLALASTFWSIDPQVTLRRSLALALTTVFAYYVASRFPLSGILRLLLVALAAGTFLSIAWAFAFPVYAIDLEGNWMGVSTHKNALARAQVLTVLVALFAWPTMRWRLPALVVAGAAIFTLMMTRGTTGTVALLTLAALLPIWAALRARRTMLGAVLLSLVVVSAAGAALVITNFADLVELTGKDPTLTGRTDLWDATLQRIADRPILGHGFEVFWTGWSGPSGELWLDVGWQTPHSHNGLLEAMLNLGLLGGLLLMALTVRGVFRSVTFARNRPGLLGLFPVTVIGFSVLYSTSERGVVVAHSIYWVLLVIVLLTVGGDDGRVPQRERASAAPADAPETSR
jgi:exopolysaccharide production protein ExoQ